MVALNIHDESNPQGLLIGEQLSYFYSISIQDLKKFNILIADSESALVQKLENEKLKKEKRDKKRKKVALKLAQQTIELLDEIRSSTEDETASQPVESKLTTPIKLTLPVEIQQSNPVKTLNKEVCTLKKLPAWGKTVEKYDFEFPTEAQFNACPPGTTLKSISFKRVGEFSTIGSVQCNLSDGTYSPYFEVKKGDYR